MTPDPPHTLCLHELKRCPLRRWAPGQHLLQPAAARAKGRHVCTQRRSIQPLPAAAAGVMGTSRSFFRPPGDRLQQVCLSIDLRNPAAIRVKALRKGAPAGDLAQGRASATVLAAVLASLYSCPHHHHAYDAVTGPVSSLTYISHIFLAAETPSAKVSRLSDKGDRGTTLVIATAHCQ